MDPYDPDTDVKVECPGDFENICCLVDGSDG